MNMNICELRHVPDNDGPYLTLLTDDRALVLTVEPERVVVCRSCPNWHVVVLRNVTVATVREMADGLLALARQMEGGDVRH